MKQILLLALIFLASNTQAQLEITPNDMTKKIELDLLNSGSSTKLQYHIINTATEDDTLRWCIRQTAGPEVWVPQICVNTESGGCFG